METGGRPPEWVCHHYLIPFILIEPAIAVSLLKKIKEAVAESNEHKSLHHQFVLGLPEDSVKRWEEELEKWEEDHTKPNPFEKKFKSTFSICSICAFFHPPYPSS
jgi:hypothetical protein